MELHRSAFKHGLDALEIEHAVEHPIAIVDLEPDADPPKVLLIGSDKSGNLLEVIWLKFADERVLVIHAMPLRQAFFPLLANRGMHD